MSERAGLAVVTGASSGIGRELAKQFAHHGFDLVINAEGTGLEQVAEELRRTGVEVWPVQADLSRYDDVERLHSEVRAAGRPVDVAALNAGVGQGGSFAASDLADELAVIQLNVVSTVHLAKLLVNDMVARGAGKLLFTSSIASMMPGPYQATYNASKSFVQSFAEALADELRGTGVTVTSLEPGPTATDFFRRARMLDTRLGQSSKDDPASVAEQGVEALMAGRRKIVAGSRTTKAMGLVNSVLPDGVKAAAHRLLAKPRASG
ncbi:SDR family NAD(P)-dependent oxidoreductase [Saccharopolyspora rectivirgula]|uniref:Oxidoreductase n=1 Tax=Saccharopolyspora rectivirgula TaxID=28042 RepID=A0A073B044_9PSEU|nr:SDR family NAD(P)-dependent oxidoreductase [Saccharopolyspora rectivirgula]KEI44951.1 oxidoreductase [Saccharopolyspora rectivirgula]